MEFPRLRPGERGPDRDGRPFAADRFYGTSLPVKLPYPDDFPLSGWVDAATVKAVHEAFEKGKDPEMDGETASIVRCIRGWFREAAALGLPMSAASTRPDLPCPRPPAVPSTPNPDNGGPRGQARHEPR